MSRSTRMCESDLRNQKKPGHVAGFFDGECKRGKLQLMGPGHTRIMIDAVTARKQGVLV